MIINLINKYDDYSKDVENTACFKKVFLLVYRLYRVRGIVRIIPSKFGKSLEESAFEELRNRYEGAIISNMGIVVSVIDVKVNPLGKILLGDGATYHEVEFTLLCFNPFQHEIVEGEINTVIPEGLFIDLGAQDGFIHLSQISEEKVEYDPSRPGFILKQSKRIIEKNNIVRARVYGMSIQKGKGFRIQLTIRQPLLGRIDWIRKTVSSK